MVQLMQAPPLASLKSRIVLPFWCWLTQVVLEKRPLNGRLSVLHILQTMGGEAFLPDNGWGSISKCRCKDNLHRLIGRFADNPYWPTVVYTTGKSQTYNSDDNTCPSKRPFLA